MNGSLCDLLSSSVRLYEKWTHCLINPRLRIMNGGVLRVNNHSRTRLGCAGAAVLDMSTCDQCLFRSICPEHCYKFLATRLPTASGELSPSLRPFVLIEKGGHQYRQPNHLVSHSSIPVLMIGTTRFRYSYSFVVSISAASACRQRHRQLPFRTQQLCRFDFRVVLYQLLHTTSQRHHQRP